MKTVEEAINCRWSTRRMDPNKHVADEDMNLIINAGIKAPSGFNAEAWKFLVVTGNKKRLSVACSSQPAITECSKLVFYLYTKTAGFCIEEYQNRLERNNVPEEAIKTHKEIVTDLSKGNYLEVQTYFAVSQMVLQATALGIDTLIIGGFDEDALIKELNIDKEKYGIALITAYGYGIGKGKPRITKPFEEVVSFMELT